MQVSCIVRPCPMCGGRGDPIRRLRYALFDDLDCSGESDLIACVSCGFVFNDLKAGSEKLRAYYRQNEHCLSSNTAGSGGDSATEQARYRRVTALMLPFLKPDSAILDVGCGKGGLLRHLEQTGYGALYGVEASNACRAHIADTSTIAVAAGLSGLPTTRAFDCVFLSHVLEHVYHPLQFLRELVQSAAPNACFYIEVPNTAALPGASAPWSWLYFEHINHFDSDALVEMASYAGLSLRQGSQWSFDPETGLANECIYGVFEKTNEVCLESRCVERRLAQKLDHGLPAGPLSLESQAMLESSDRPLALWGLSQYALLVLGMYPNVAQRIAALYDASPAKAGRRLNGIRVEYPKSLDRLPADCLLLLPRSSYTPGMIESLPSLGFAGEYELF